MANRDTLYFPWRPDNQHRWEFISNHINGSHESALDLGCAEGLFSIKLAEEGLDVTGIDANDQRLRVARNHELDNLEFLNYAIRPPDFALPKSADVILCMTLHHHMAMDNSSWAALDFLKRLCELSDLLIYEVPGTMWIPAYRVRMTCKQEGTNEVRNDIAKIDGRKIEQLDLPNGHYQIQTSTPWFNPSDWTSIEISDKTLDTPLLHDVDPDNRQLELIKAPEQVTEYNTHNKAHYDYLITEILNGNIVGDVETQYNRSYRTDYIYAIE
jgi:SAM-dependent methyltransferase